VIDAFKSMGALAGLMKNKEKLAESAERVKARLAQVRVDGEAGAGAVRVTASGEMKILEVHIEPAVASSFGDDSSLTASVGYHENDTAGRSSYFGENVIQGNSYDPVTGSYIYANIGAQAYLEFTTSLFGMTFQAYGEYVQNQDAPDDDTGYLFGLSLGSAKGPGSWSIEWYYEELARDAVLGLLTDSDFGLGGTDARGNVFKGAYAFRKNVSTSFALYLTEVGEDRGTHQHAHRAWTATLAVTVLGYSVFFYHAAVGLPGVPYPSQFMLAGWRDLGWQVEALEDQLEKARGTEPLVVGLDKYGIASRLAFYRLRDEPVVPHHGNEEAVTGTSGRHLVGGERFDLRDQLRQRAVQEPIGGVGERPRATLIDFGVQRGDLGCERCDGGLTIRTRRGCDRRLEPLQMIFVVGAPRPAGRAQC